uniref:Uncharacterized protein n=1 Tax=Arundo donax TaxID=35708 RepID=A0A0A9F9B5_ARUDO
MHVFGNRHLFKRNFSSTE